MDISQFNLEYLRIRSGPESLQLPPDEIKRGNGIDAKRSIFHNVPHDNFEQQQIRNLETELAERGVTVPLKWRKGDMLRYLYSSKFDLEKTVKSIQDCLEWRNNPVSRTVSKEVLKLYESGVVYMYGRDKQYRPILVFDFGKVDVDKVKSEDFNAAVTILLDLAMDFCHLPGKVEGCVLLLDTRNVSVTKLPISHLKNWMTIGTACFPSVTVKTYVIGPPFVLRMSWKLIEGVMEKDTAAKIEILPIDELNKMQTLIDSSQLEEKFGGSLPNLSSFWLPKPTYAPTPSQSRKSLQSLHEIQEISYENDPTSTKFRNLALSGYQIPQSVPVSHNRFVEDGRYTPGARPGHTSSNSPQKSGRSGIFEKTSRTTLGAHSPMRVRDKDESLVNEILAQRARPSAPNFQLRQVEPPSSMDLSQNYTDLTQSMRREKVKAAAPAPAEDYNEGSTFYPEPENLSHINFGGDIMSMIVKEDKYLKKHADPMQPIPDEHNGYDDRINERKTAETKLKQYVDLTHSPQNRQRMTNSPSTEKTNRYSVEPFGKETQKKSRPVQQKPDSQYEPPSRFDTSYESYKSASLIGRDLNRSLLGDLNSTNNKQVEEWNPRKKREIPIPQEIMEESDDDDMNFCGLCVGGKKKNKNQNVKEPKRESRRII